MSRAAAWLCSLVMTDSYTSSARGSSPAELSALFNPPTITAPIPAELRSVGTAVFGEALPLAERYATLLAEVGVHWGLLGPREVPRLWERHLLNCAVVSELVGHDAPVIDVGSGAGLPGLPLALAQPSLSVILVEPLLRRWRFLAAAVDSLGLTGRVTVRRSRAEELRGELSAPLVVARAVAPLGKLASWCLPLIKPGGRLLAMKGASAEGELADASGVLSRSGIESARILTCGEGVVAPPVTVVEVCRSGPNAGRARR